MRLCISAVGSACRADPPWQGSWVESRRAKTPQFGVRCGASRFQGRRQIPGCHVFQSGSDVKKPFGQASVSNSTLFERTARRNRLSSWEMVANAILVPSTLVPDPLTPAFPRPRLAVQRVIQTCPFAAAPEVSRCRPASAANCVPLHATSNARSC